MKTGMTQLKIQVPIEIRDAIRKLAVEDNRSMHSYLQVMLAKLAERAQ
jgi:hypothetical protein